MCVFMIWTDSKDMENNDKVTLGITLFVRMVIIMF